MITNATHSTKNTNKKPQTSSTGSASNSANACRATATMKPSVPANGNSASKPDASGLSTEARSTDNPDSRVSGLLSGISEWGGQEAPTEAANQQDSQITATDSPSQRLNLGEGELLRSGSQNSEQVTQLQEMLNSGGGQLEVDGVFGPRTAEAVREFQRCNNLTVDGIVGPQTMAALNGGGRSGTEQAQGGAGEGTPGGAPSETGTNPDPATPGRSTSALEGLPPRPENARGGREFMDSIAGLPPGRQRDQAVLNEILSGNIPDNLRQMQEVVVNRGGHEIRMQATPDYLSIGSNEDNVRIPMTPGVAQAIADRTGTSLPTDRMVDDIQSQARHLNMAPMSNNREGISTYLQHDQRIDGQLGSGTAPTGLVSGHKKDLVIPARDGRVAIYGGRWANGGLIQPYSNVHNNSYEDYSHGARLVSQQIVIDGRPMSLSDALADPQLAPLLTNHRGGSFRY